MVSNVYDVRMYGSPKTNIYEACYIFATSKNAWIEKSTLGKYLFQPVALFCNYC